MAIGTIGAVIVSLYLNNQNRSENHKTKLTETLYKGIEILDILQHYERLIIAHHNNNSNYDDELRIKLNQFQWDLGFLLNIESHPECFDLLYKVSGQTHRIACLFIKIFIKRNIDLNFISNSNHSYTDLYNQYIIGSNYVKIYDRQLTAKFNNLNNIYLRIKSEYRYLASNLIKW